MKHHRRARRFVDSSGWTLLASTAAAAILLSHHSGLAAPAPITLFHNFGPALEDCPGFDLHLAFARGRITFEGAKRTDGSNLQWTFGTDPKGPMTLALGTGPCALLLKLDRQSP